MIITTTIIITTMVLMIEIMIIVILEVLVTITLISIIIRMTYKRNYMEKKKNNKDLIWTRNWSGKYAKKYFSLSNVTSTDRYTKILPKIKIKTMGHLTPFMDHYPRNG